MFTSRLVSHFKLIRSFSTTIAAMLSLTLLTGCLVHSDGTKTYLRTSENIHIYQAGDYITYNVYGTESASTTSPTTSVNGTLRIEWSPPTPTKTIQNPSTGNISLLQETATLTVGTTTKHVIRYITQDQVPTSPTYGTIYLHALDSYNNPNNPEYWISPANTSTTTNLSPVAIMQSPVALTTPSSINDIFYVFNSCTPPNGGCNSNLGYQSETYDVTSDNVNVTTDGGIFNTLKIALSPGLKFFDTTNSSNLSAFPIELDFRNSCSTKNATFNGTMFAYPEVGIVLMYVQCSDSAGGPTFFYTISYSGSGGSIALPSPS